MVSVFHFKCFFVASQGIKEFRESTARYYMVFLDARLPVLFAVQRITRMVVLRNMITHAADASAIVIRPVIPAVGNALFLR